MLSGAQDRRRRTIHFCPVPGARVDADRKERGAGPASVGKCFLVQPLGYSAVRTVRFSRADDFFKAMSQARSEALTLWITGPVALSRPTAADVSSHFAIMPLTGSIVAAGRVQSATPRRQARR